MAAQQPPTGSDRELIAQRSADRLALALEDVGFDVGRAFPQLSGGLDRDGGPIIDVGHIPVSVADKLTAVLSRAAGATGVLDEPE